MQGANGRRVGEKGLLCIPGYVFGLVGTEKRRAQVINGITKKHSAGDMVNM